MPVTVTYDIADAALLSDQARALSADALRDQTVIAEMLLGLAGTTFTGEPAERVKLALARQVNTQLEHGVEGSVYASYSQGGRSFTFLSGIPVDALAASLVLGLTGTAGSADRFADMRSLRRGNS